MLKNTSDILVFSNINKFIPYNWTKGYLNNDGTITEDSDYAVSDFIKVTGNYSCISTKVWCTYYSSYVRYDYWVGTYPNYRTQSYTGYIRITILADKWYEFKVKNQNDLLIFDGQSVQKPNWI